MPDHRAQIFQHSRKVVAHFVVPVANHPEPFMLEIACSVLIRRAVAVLSAVQLDYQIELAAQEITDVRADWHLARELPAAQLPAAQMPPHQAFSWRRLIAQFLRSACWSPWRVGHV